MAVKVSDGVFLSWRITGQEWYDVQYNVYRNGTKLNASPLDVSNYTDKSGALASTYTVKSVLNGVEGDACPAVSVLSNSYLEIPMRAITHKGKDISHLFSLNDATVADLDGDGQMEVIIKRINSDFSVANDSAFTFFEAYKLNGTFMWAINCGPNMVSSSHVETNIFAFDLDGDGKAELVMRTADGAIDGEGDVIGSASLNYRSYVNQTANMQYMTQGAEYLCLLDGETGGLLDKVDYIARGKASDWGDDYGHRSNKFFFGAPYLDGRKPSLLTTRGIYTRIVMRAYDVVNKKFVTRWAEDFDTNNSKWSAYAYQGNHNYTIADVDGDGRDEVVYGSMVVDDDGNGLYSTGYGHGDAIHVGDFDPYHKGIEIFTCLENSPHWGAAFRDGATGEAFIKYVHGSDCGRCNAGKVTDDFLGAQLWAGGNMWSATTRERVGNSGGSENFILYWDGDLLQETFDYSSLGDVTSKGYGTPAIFKYGTSGPIRTFVGTATNNYTKGNPCMQVDIFGDWREELILRTDDDKALRIYTTTDPTEYRNYTLLHDYQYRQAIAWQMCGYNQPPHVSYFLGKAEGILLPPPPVMTNDRTEVGTQIDASGNGKHLLMANTAGGNVSLSATVTPTVMTISSPADYTIGGTGIFGGEMKLVKQGMGALTMSGNHSYTGVTELWDGVFNFEGTLAGPVWMNRFAEMNTTATFNGGLTMEYGAILRVAANNSKANLQTASLYMKRGSIAEIDIYSDDLSADIIKVSGDLKVDSAAVFRFIQHNKAGASVPAAGRYTIVEVGGNFIGELSKATIEGMPGVLCSLVFDAGKLYLEVTSLRAAAPVVWNGTEQNSIWDLATSPTFLLNGVGSSFVSDDNVSFTDDAANKNVTIAADVYPASVVINNTEEYLFDGTGKISGQASLTKQGTGQLTINNVNSYTGKTEINGGVVEVASLATSQKGGAFGALSSDPAQLVINNATLKVSASITNESALTVKGNDAIFDITGTLTQMGVIAGETLTKTGNGALVISAVNTHKKTILKAGTIRMLEEPNLHNGYLGDTLVIEGGTVDCLNNSYSYSSANWNIVVPKGKTGRINLDGRCDYKGALKGEGTLTIYSPYVRSDLSGNWSEFAGTVKATGGEFRLNNSYGMPLAILDLASGTNAYSEKITAFSLGNISGAGTLANGITWTVGSNNKAGTFDGVIAGNLVKVGTGNLTLKGESTSASTIDIKEGTLTINNSDKTNSATGVGELTIYNGATLTGKGTIANSRVVIKDGGTLVTGYLNSGTLSAKTGIVQEEGGVLQFRLNGNASVVSLDNVTGMNLKGTIKVTLKSSYTPALNDSYNLWTAKSVNSQSAPIFDLPELPAGLAWDTSQLVSRSGLLKVTDASGLNLTSWDELIRVTLITTDGVVLETSECRANEVDAYIAQLRLNSGIYLLKMDSERGSSVKKFLK